MHGRLDETNAQFAEIRAFMAAMMGQGVVMPVFSGPVATSSSDPVPEAPEPEAPMDTSDGDLVYVPSPVPSDVV